MEEQYTKDEVTLVAKKILAEIQKQNKAASLIALQGDLGAGKTTLVQSIAMLLGVSETVQSPTFVIAKFYDTDHQDFKRLVHIDAYRIESIAELEVLGWNDLLRDPETLVIVEWPERIAEALPSNRQHYTISHNKESRHIKLL
jgi:tRNA threonylcarbamoyl adenosine modification protein YjeE